MPTGSCACGQIRYSSEVPLMNGSCCHCSQCRKMSGHVWASAQVPQEALTITGPVHWISLTPRARRGVCPGCGAFLFWQGTNEDSISIGLGTLDAPVSVTLEKHIFTADKGSYYQLTDGLPQRP
ncbi:GFA family protein [Thalassobius sp. S69A]|uniref:GFA family protein n=1 Tax=unclassified Thalassovita TaxID=2619711 RepID=UPI000C0E7C6F|nr:aldehyde-activating protein [Paracoccaceae bacterium]MBT27212.1 aldehyde-activating protein [Paracoccaceae bacterium]